MTEKKKKNPEETTRSRSTSRSKSGSTSRSSNLKVLMVTAEAAPFAKVGGLADVAGSLPVRLAERGMEVRVVLPFYREVALQGYKPADSGLSATIPHAGGPRRCRFLDLPVEGARYWFLDEPAYYDRDGVYGPAGDEYPDNAQRYAFLCRGALEAARAFGFTPDVVHCHDWHAALVPVYMAQEGRSGPWGGAVSVLTIHNLAYQGVFGAQVLPSLGLPEELFAGGLLEYGGRLNFLKAGIEIADLITTVSPTYAVEIRTAEQGWGLDGILSRRSEALAGVLNGIDYDHWDPARDGSIAAPFTAADPSGRAVNARVLRKQLGLYPDVDSPLFAFVGRLVSQKGADLLARAIPEMVSSGCQIVVLGSGEFTLEESLRSSAKPYPGRVSVNIGFNDSLARRIYAGSDFFIMPSRFEPCGLGQMIAMRYGSLPVVRDTGGLRDTVRDVGEDPLGNGILFKEANEGDLLEAVARAVELHRTGRMPVLVKRIMAEDHSWRHSAGEYEDLYRRSAAKRKGGQP